jgi:hypothetical protein
VPAAETTGMGMNGIETLTERIRAAVLERERLRASSANREQLERNRLEIVELQRRFSAALIAHYRPAAA